MKKFSVIIASMLFFAGMTFAQQNQKSSQPTVKKGSSTSATGTTSGTAGTVKKVPANKGKATPAAKANAAPATGTTGK